MANIESGFGPARTGTFALQPAGRPALHSFRRASLQTLANPRKAYCTYFSTDSSMPIPFTVYAMQLIVFSRHFP
jgi:hypothetical protein